MSDADKSSVADATFAVSEGIEQWDEIKDRVRALKDRAGAQFKLLPVADNWPDVEYWGARRQSVTRISSMMCTPCRGDACGPDLSNVGARQLDLNALYAKIYNSQAGGQSSHMPPYKYLFNVRPAKEGEEFPANAVTVSLPVTELNNRSNPTSLSRRLIKRVPWPRIRKASETRARLRHRYRLSARPAILRKARVRWKKSILT